MAEQKQRLNLYISQKTKKKIEALAEIRGITKSKVIESLLEGENICNDCGFKDQLNERDGLDVVLDRLYISVDDYKLMLRVMIGEYDLFDYLNLKKQGEDLEINLTENFLRYKGESHKKKINNFETFKWAIESWNSIHKGIINQIQIHGHEVILKLKRLAGFEIFPLINLDRFLSEFNFIYQINEVGSGLIVLEYLNKADVRKVKNQRHNLLLNKMDDLRTSFRRLVLRRISVIGIPIGSFDIVQKYAPFKAILFIIEQIYDKLKKYFNISNDDSSIEEISKKLDENNLIKFYDISFSNRNRNLKILFECSSIGLQNFIKALIIAWSKDLDWKIKKLEMFHKDWFENKKIENGIRCELEK
ncbi:MAG: hypothetical protein ACTSVY_02050 [Candidatus Helarchaeota archaeon]